jgi:uncharacterized protein (DUF302 family)
VNERFRKSRWWVAFCLLLSATQSAGLEDALVLTASTRKTFQDVIDDLEFAITERNFRITGRNTIGAGIRARGYSDFPNVEIIHFCSLELTREILSAEPDFAIQMPCRIAVQVEGKQTVIRAALLPEQQAQVGIRDTVRKVNQMLREIVTYAAKTD